jgi:single-strand DNA-binding protein
MNLVILCGRLTRDPDVRYSQTANGSMAVARYSLAVDRRFKREGEPNADFINCIAFGKNGEFAEKYLHKGTKIIVNGHIQTGSYTNKDGKKVYTTDVIIESQEFAESKNGQQGGGQRNGGNTQPLPPPMPDGEPEFLQIPDGIQEEMPFT